MEETISRLDQVSWQKQVAVLFNFIQVIFFLPYANAILVLSFSTVNGPVNSKACGLDSNL